MPAVLQRSQGQIYKKRCHEELEAHAHGIAGYALTLMHSVRAFALTFRVPQGDTLHFLAQSL